MESARAKDGSVFSGNSTDFVQDVAGETNYLSCSPDVRAEIVIPLFRGDEIIGELETLLPSLRVSVYTYRDHGDNLVFMDMESFDEESIPKSAVGDFMRFIKEGDVMQIAIYQGEAISIEPPQTVVLKVCDPYGECDTDATSVTVNNLPPTANAGLDQTVYRNDIVSLAGTWTDPAADYDNPYAWTWDVTGDAVVDFSGSASVRVD